MDLPPFWKFALDERGRIYYYHVKIRKSQWEPPKKTASMVDKSISTEIKKESEDSKTDSDSCTASDGETSTDKSEKSTKESGHDTDTVTEKEIEKERTKTRKRRYNMLVQERSISPRREEDRIFNQNNIKRYRRNKEKIRRRREEIKRRRLVSLQQQLDSGILEVNENEDNDNDNESSSAPLPIQDYLISSDEDDSPLMEKFVKGDKIVDELDALANEKPLKRRLSLKARNGIHSDVAAESERVNNNSRENTNSVSPSGSSNTNMMRKPLTEVEEKFRYDIGNVIIEVLTPYRQETCQEGKITTNEDFIYLAKKLIHLIFQKELKYCRSVGQTIRVTESVKKKSNEFIRNYMKKYGAIYYRPRKDS